MKEVIKLTCSVYRNYSPRVAEALQKAGIRHYQQQSGRAVVLRERKRLFGMLTETVLEDDPADIFKLYVPAEAEESLMSFLASEAGLAIPGRGSIYSEEVSLDDRSDRFISAASSLPAPGPSPAPFTQDIAGICCIVQREQAQSVIRVGLNLGFCVPTVTYGEGMGVRDKLGILRIAIPAEKEIMTMIVSRQDTDEIMNALIDVGRLDQPGKGFIYSYPLRKGILNTRTLRGQFLQAASTEQIISTIDHLSGGTEWRKLESAATQSVSRKRKFLTDLTSLNVVCNEGRADSLVKTAMAAGAPGATISRFHSVLAEDSPEKDISPSREIGDLIVSPAAHPVILKALEEAGLHEKEAAGLCESGPIPKACTYLGGG